MDWPDIRFPDTDMDVFLGQKKKKIQKESLKAFKGLDTWFNLKAEFVKQLWRTGWTFWLKTDRLNNKFFSSLEDNLFKFTRDV